MVGRPLELEDHQIEVAQVITDETSEPREWLAALERHLVDQDQIDLLQEQLGLTLLGDFWRWKKLPIWTGRKDTAKSAVAKVVEMMLPAPWRRRR